MTDRLLHVIDVYFPFLDIPFIDNHPLFTFVVICALFLCGCYSILDTHLRKK